MFLIEYITISVHDKITTIYSIIRVSINKRITCVSCGEVV